MSTLMMRSVREQPEALSRLLAGWPDTAAILEAFAARSIRKVWLLGSGTSLFAAMIAARAWEGALATDCEAVSSLEFVDDELTRVGPHDLVVAISQSGSSLTLLEAVRGAQSAGALTITITADPQAPVPAASAFVVDCLTGDERNLGKTKGFTTTAVAAVMLGDEIAGSQGRRSVGRAGYTGLPSAFLAAIEGSEPVVARVTEQFSRCDALFVVGSGNTVPTALEGGLKILEVAKLPVLTKELEEMMHGPYNGVGPQTGIIVVADETVRGDRLDRFLAGTRLIGTPTFTIAAPASDQAPAPFDLVLPPLAEPAQRAILSIVPFQLLAASLATARGVPVDHARYPQLYPVFASKSIHL